MNVPLLDVQGLAVEFDTARGRIQALRGVDLNLKKGETLVVIGESGSGKSVTAEVILGIMQSPPGRVTAGRVLYQGGDLLALPPQGRRRIQGDRVAMVFQDALAALNPLYTVGWQIAELFRVHRGWTMNRGYERAIELLRQVGIPNPAERVHQYPHQFSGGMRQRVMIALAIALEPDLLLADEPTTALDVTVQAQIMQLLAQLRAETGMGLILITHDIAVAAEVADRVAVMYAGRIVETGPIVEVLEAPAHPYTRALVRLALHDRRSGGRPTIPGTPPDLLSLPAGCAFAPRCPVVRPVCHQADPSLELVTATQSAACHFSREVDVA
ncbi:MAG: ABC transporter ATP-binding protein [Alphaproteobacteria bacterium]|nr:MAG: ABC transporter ATP-binding protein [Alphaproteobacteria bacterium]